MLTSTHMDICMRNSLSNWLFSAIRVSTNAQFELSRQLIFSPWGVLYSRSIVRDLYGSRARVRQPLGQRTKKRIIYSRQSASSSKSAMDGSCLLEQALCHRYPICAGLLQHSFIHSKWVYWWPWYKPKTEFYPSTGEGCGGVIWMRQSDEYKLSYTFPPLS